jgi:Rad3-related DNA helicase
VTLEEIIIEESHNLSFPHGRNLRSIAFHVRKLEDWAKQLENENDTFKKRIKRLEDSYAAKDKQLSNLLHICRDNDIEVSSYDLIHGKEAKL